MFCDVPSNWENFFQLYDNFNKKKLKFCLADPVIFCYSLATLVVNGLCHFSQAGQTDIATMPKHVITFTVSGGGGGVNNK
jgi:hypothetical protein